MSFLIDKQTFTDLEIFEQRDVKKSVFKLFDRTITLGGKEELHRMFLQPLTDSKAIIERQELIRYLGNEKLMISIDKLLLDFIESYLFLNNDKPVHVSRINAWHKYLKYKLSAVNENYVIQRGIKDTIEFLQKLYLNVTENSLQRRPKLLERRFCFIADCIRNTELRRIIGFNSKKEIGAMNNERFDHIFRYREFDTLKKIISVVYQIDAFRAVSETMKDFGLTIPEISDNIGIKITGLYHPFVKSAVTNDIRLDEKSNLFFITGGNMAGKSTFLKAFGVSIYLAHLGFPVAASSMCTSIFNGLFSTINIADSLSKGYSHFYNEVLRVKTVAENINKTGKLVVIFDELFRGTNVKDAYDASLTIISAFAKITDSMFLVSSHIMEVANKLRTIANIRFGYFSTFIREETPQYSYRLCEGVTEDRLGMLIIKNEKIVEIIEAGNKPDAGFQS
ncbi:MAG: hypothetical protein LBV74_22150 [Tannerella sp.]|jgi:DNA mismatch repair ATPase MutS|nr:hypothetical protein [Tannerella sp.]